MTNLRIGICNIVTTVKGIHISQPNCELFHSKFFKKDIFNKVNILSECHRITLIDKHLP